MNGSKLAGVALLVVAVGGGCFFGGMKYQQSQTSTSLSARFAGGFPGGPGQNGQMANGRSGSSASFAPPIQGEIVSIDNGGFTIKARDGSSKNVLTSKDTKVTKMASVDETALKAGTKVRVMGTDNPDDSITAESVQIDPQALGRRAGATP